MSKYYYLVFSLGLMWFLIIERIQQPYLNMNKLYKKNLSNFFLLNNKLTLSLNALQTMKTSEYRTNWKYELLLAKEIASVFLWRFISTSHVCFK